MTLGIPNDQAAFAEGSRTVEPAPSPFTELFTGAGATREACRRHDWNASTLGHQSQWPPALSSSVLHILWSVFPNLVLWGPDLLVLYNDAYLDLIGSNDVMALGLPARDVAPRIWELVSPMHERVLAGETLSRDDADLTIMRTGRAMTVRRTLSVAPVQDESGNVRGVLLTVFDSDDVPPDRAD